jgi:hypothetical protein
MQKKSAFSFEKHEVESGLSRESESGGYTMYRFLCFISMLAAAGTAGAATVRIPALPDAVPAAFQTEQFFPMDGIPLSEAEAGQYSGGDVRVDMDDSRTSVTVRVYDPSPDPRPWGARPDEIYTLPISARVQDTIYAPFFPTSASAFATRGLSGLTTRPVAFPEGIWKITGIREESGQYGPFFINTNAVGRVDVYQYGRFLGVYADVGYAGHSSGRGLDGLTNGCFIMTKSDDLRLAKTLLADRALAASERTTTIQTLHVRDIDRE